MSSAAQNAGATHDTERRPPPACTGSLHVAPKPRTELPTLAIVVHDAGAGHEIPIGASGSSVGFRSARTAGPHVPPVRLNTKPRASAAAHAVGDAHDTLRSIPGKSRGFVAAPHAPPL